MPSLQDLEKFKTSFSSLGGELQTLQELEIPTDDLPLPDHEAAAPTTDETPNLSELLTESGTDEPPEEPYDPDNSSSGIPGFGDMSDLLGGNLSTGESSVAEPGGEEAGAESLGDFLNTIPDDFGPEEGAGEIPIPEDESASGLPSELLNGFADEMESSGEDRKSVV
jgi:hypothetical protein